MSQLAPNRQAEQSIEVQSIDVPSDLALFAKEVEFLRTAFNGIAPIYSGTAPSTPQVLHDEF